MAIITLTSDFGTTDTFVGQMKGVILGIAPGATIVDLSHAVPPQDVMAGSLVLDSAVDSFPDGTIHVAVVDPGVGTNRAPVAVRVDETWLVGPDNGLFTAVLARRPSTQVVRLSNADYHRTPVSATFHGRDIFAPVAAHLANGVPPKELGEPAEALNLLAMPEPRAEGDSLALHVLCVDRFGNLITDLTAEHYSRWLSGRTSPHLTPAIHIGGQHINGISQTFSDADPGAIVAYFGSGGRLEIAVRNGNAALTLRATPGTTLHLGPTVV